MALSVTKEGQLVPPTAGPTIYGKTLDWHAVRAELASVKRREILPYQRTASVFRQSEGTLRREIEAFADDREVRLAPTADPYIGFKASILHTPQGHNLIEFVATLKYPADAGSLLHRTRYVGMPTLQEIGPSVIAYFEKIHDKVHGTWAKWDNDPRSDNFVAFDAALRQGLAPTEAVKKTPAWNSARCFGFTDIGVPTQDEEGNWTVEFYRPDATIRRHPFS